MHFCQLLRTQYNFSVFPIQIVHFFSWLKNVGRTEDELPLVTSQQGELDEEEVCWPLWVRELKFY